MPSVLYRQAEAGRHRRPSGALPSEVRQQGPGHWRRSGDANHLSLRDRLAEALQRAGEVETQLSDPKTVKDAQKMGALGRELRHLTPLVEMGNKLKKYDDELAEVRELVSLDDPEMAAVAREELTRLEGAIADLEVRIKPALIPHDPLDDRPAIVEIRGGTGGDEAAIFAADLFRLYTRFAERRGWKVEVMSMSEGALDGIKEAIFKVKGEGVFGTMRWESGVHRVQRVPVTESQGRIHTSAATVAVLPEAEEIDLKIDDKDLRIDVFRSSGPGGQSVNTTDSAVRITHLPSGIVVSQQDQKSQLQNKLKGMEVLRARLLDATIAKQEAERSRMRKTQVGTGDRSAKIRTYNFPQNRVTDHRIGFTLHELSKVMSGEIDALIDALRNADAEDRLGD